MKKRRINPIMKILIAFFIIFIALLIANYSGYYENRIRKDVFLTEEKIKEFEEKVQNGEEVDIKNFLNKENRDYSNRLSRLGDSLTSNIEVIIHDGIIMFTNIFKSLF